MKYLGLLLDKNLIFERRINSVTEKTGLLSRIRDFIDFQLAKTLYMSLIYLHFLYRNFTLDRESQTVKDGLCIAE